MVNFKNVWFDYDEEKMDLIMKYIDHKTHAEGYTLVEIGNDLNIKFELNDTELAMVYYVLGYWAAEHSKNTNHEMVEHKV